MRLSLFAPAAPEFLPSSRTAALDFSLLANRREKSPSLVTKARSAVSQLFGRAADQAKGVGQLFGRAADRAKGVGQSIVSGARELSSNAAEAWQAVRAPVRRAAHACVVGSLAMTSLAPATAQAGLIGALFGDEAPPDWVVAAASPEQRFAYGLPVMAESVRRTALPERPGPGEYRGDLNGDDPNPLSQSWESVAQDLATCYEVQAAQPTLSCAPDEIVFTEYYGPDPKTMMAMRDEARVRVAASLAAQLAAEQIEYRIVQQQININTAQVELDQARVTALQHGGDVTALERLEETIALL